jgi:hypothetical protein
VKYNNVEVCVREYREIADPAMEDLYREELAGSSPCTVVS